MLTLTPEMWKIIEEVQREGNKIVWQDDKDTWDKVELWEFPKEVRGKQYEDCDGISLWKMRALIERGIDKDFLTLVVCKTEDDFGHAILCVTTDRGDYFLDNRQSNVVSYDDIIRKGYDLLYRSTIGGRLTDPWQRIS